MQIGAKTTARIRQAATKKGASTHKRKQVDTFSGLRSAVQGGSAQLVYHCFQMSPSSTVPTIADTPTTVDIVLPCISRAHAHMHMMDKLVALAVSVRLLPVRRVRIDVRLDVWASADARKPRSQQRCRRKGIRHNLKHVGDHIEQPVECGQHAFRERLKEHARSRGHANK